LFDEIDTTSKIKELDVLEDDENLNILEHTFDEEEANKIDIS